MNNSIEKKLKNLFTLQVVEDRISEVNVLIKNIYINIKNIKKQIIRSMFTKCKFKYKIAINKNTIIKIKKRITEKIHSLKMFQCNLKNKIPEVYYNNIIKYKKRAINLDTKLVTKFKLEINNDKKELHKLERNYKSQINYYFEYQEYFIKVRTKYEKVLNYFIQKHMLLNKIIEPKLLNLYRKIRSKSKNQLAVVPVVRNIAIGYFSVIPSKIGIYLPQRKHIIIDEYSGIILIDYNLAKEVLNNLLID